MQTTHIARHVARVSFLIALGAATASAQLGDFNPPPGPHDIYAIRNVRIVPVVGAVVEHGNIVIGRDGKISAIGANAAIPSGAKTLDGSGLTAYPGMMDAGTTMGLNEIPDGVVQLDDASEIGTFKPNVHAIVAVDAHSAHIGVTRVVGITNVISRPTGGVIAGQATLLNLAGDTHDKMGLVRDIAMSMTYPRGGAGGGGGRGAGGGGAAGGRGRGAGTPVVTSTTPQMSPMDSLNMMLDDAEVYAKAQAAYAKDKTLPRPRHDVILESLVPFVQGKQPALFEADASNDIRDIVTWAESHHIKPIILGGRQALAVAPFLKQHNVPVILTSVMTLPQGDDDAYDLNYALPSKLAAAGVTFAIASGAEPGDERNLPYVAGMAAAFGLSKDDALKSVTLWPAQIFGVGDKLGSLETGKLANLVVTTGDMLEPKTETRMLFIDGCPVPLSNKHTYEYEMYKDRHGGGNH